MSGMEEKTTVKIGRTVVQNGIMGAMQDLINVIMLEDKINRREAIEIAAKFLEDLKKLIIEDPEDTNEH